MPIQDCQQHLLDSCVVSYKNNGSSLRQPHGPIQAAISICYIAAWANTKTTEILSQLYGPIQASWKQVLDSHVGPYKNNDSTPQAALWAHTGKHWHTGLPATFVKLLHGPYKDNGSTP